MENNRIKEATSAISQSLGIDLEVIVNNAQLESQQKFRLIYEKVLTASLTKWIKNDEKGKLGLPSDFSVKDFVAQQLAALPAEGEAIVTGGSMQCIPNLLLSPELIAETKQAKGKEVEVVVNKLFDLSSAVLQNEHMTWPDFFTLCIKQGLYGISEIGGAAFVVAAMAAALSAPTFGAALAIGVAAGFLAVGITVVISFFSLLYSIFTSGILFDRNFFGVVLNDTDNDLLIPSWKDKSNAKSRYSGIYCRHGRLSALMVDSYGDGQAAIVAKREEIEDRRFCYCGLYLLEKNTSPNGSEGFFRFEINRVKFDLNATCPMSSHNRLYTSFNHTDKTLYAANSDVANEWKKKKGDELLYGKDTKNGVSVTYSLNKLSGSPAYGITTVE